MTCARCDALLTELAETTAALERLTNAAKAMIAAKADRSRMVETEGLHAKHESGGPAGICPKEE